MGPRAAMACTVAVEEVIDEHYREQAERLGAAESGLKSTIEEFRMEELEHRDTALDHGAERAVGYLVLSALVKSGSRMAIWLSTRI
jgi:ubiquinone biosynthesis monooxygenase Coq7